MNEEKFKKEARKTLHRQSPEQVERFLTNFPYNPVLNGYEVFDGVQKMITDKFFVKHAAEALKHLKPINNGKCIPNEWKQDMNTMIERLEKVVDFNEKRISRGTKSKLSETDAIRLTMLKEVFEKCFPDLKSNFKKGKLRDLGVLLLGKSLPTRNPDKQVEEFYKNKKLQN